MAYRQSAYRKTWRGGVKMFAALGFVAGLTAKALVSKLLLTTAFTAVTTATTITVSKMLDDE
jgi:hypothetical protein